MIVMLSSCLPRGKREATYEIKRPFNGKFHSIIKITNSNKGSCTAFVINDNTAMTSGHCLRMTILWKKNGLAEEVKMLEAKIAYIESMLFEVINRCIVRTPQCTRAIAMGRSGLDKLRRQLRYIKETKVDELKVYTIDGKYTNIVAKAMYRHPRRDYGFIRGDFKDFNHMKLKRGFDARPGDVFKVCGFPGAVKYAQCTDFIAVGSYNFKYRGRSLFQKGLSGSPVIDSDGLVIGIASSVKDEYSYFEPIMGTLILR